MKNLFLIVLTVLVAGLIGYWLGKKTPYRCEPNYIKEGSVGFMAIVPLQRGRLLDSNLTMYKECELSPEVASVMGNPINIPKAKVDFDSIFKQKDVVGLRVYPGLKVLGDGEKKMTLIFIGTDSAGNNVYLPSAQRTNPQQKPDQAVIQDQNDICPPKCKSVL